MSRHIKLLLVTISLTVSFISAYAYDFLVDGIAYNVVSLPDMTCEITKSDTNYSHDIVIPSTVTYQGRKLTVVRIGDKAFWKCNSLTSVRIPNSVTEIGANAFNGCTSLTAVRIPNSVTEIKGGTFYGCSSLTAIEIPNSVTGIGAYAFSGCALLTAVEIPNSVTEIGDYAFSGCASLTTVEIPNSITEISEAVFSNCSSLTSVPIPHSVTGIGLRAFYQCSSLTSIEIPKSVTNIQEETFEECPLESIIWGPDMDIIFADERSIYINYASLEYLQILPSKEAITISPLTLRHLRVLSSGRSLYSTSMPFGKYISCPSLSDLCLTGYTKYTNIEGPVKNLTIGKGVELTPGYFGADMSRFTTLECVTMKGNVPQFVPTFTNAVYLNATLRVPKGTKQAYQNAEGWKNFWNIEESEEEVGIDEVPEVAGSRTECGRYDLQGRHVDESYRGVSIVRYTDGSAKKVVTAH